MKTFIKSTIAIVIIILASYNFAQAGNTNAKKAPQKSNITNPYYNPNKKIVNSNNQPIINKNRKEGEPFFNRRNQPFLNVKRAPKKFQQ